MVTIQARLKTVIVGLIVVVLVLGFGSLIGAAVGDITLEGWLIDKCCSGTPDPVKHTRQCNLMETCAATGYGILVKQTDNSLKFYPFDKTGQQLAKDYLQHTTRSNNLRIAIKAKWDGNVLSEIVLTE